MERDKEKVALVIGGSRGIGRQVAIGLSTNGYYVVVAAKTTSDAYKADPFHLIQIRPNLQSTRLFERSKKQEEMPLLCQWTFEV